MESQPSDGWRSSGNESQGSSDDNASDDSRHNTALRDANFDPASGRGPKSIGLQHNPSACEMRDMKDDDSM